ncbi:MAG: ribosome maturation factor RimM [Alphaproteobacteria bacterium]
MPRSEQVCLGIVVGVHGVKGMVRLKSFTAQPADIAAYGAVSDEGGARRFKIEVAGMARGAVLARLSGVANREAAEALRGVRLYVPRTALPKTNQDEFYHADLIGLPVETKEGARLGTVSAVHNFGAGDILELRGDNGRELLLPFSDAVVPTVDLEAGRIVADPPASLLEDRAKAESRDADRAARRRRLDERRNRGSESGGGAGL